MPGRARRRALATCALTAVTSAAVVLCAASAGASTFKPTRFDDPTPGKCKPSDCSLREAVNAANKRPGEDVIALGPRTYRLEIPQASPDTPRIGDLDVIGPAAVKGKGARQTKVRGSGSGRVFELDVAGRVGRPDYSLSRMAVTGGLASAQDGGAIFVGFSSTRLKQLVVADNQAQRGGGVAAAGAELTISNTTIRRDNGASSGGGFFAPAAPNDTGVTIRASTISDNDGSVGGGVELDGLNAPGADREPTLGIANSTIAGNHAFNGGGGIAALNGATITLDNATVAYNDASSEDGFGSGGGIEQLGTAVVDAGDSIVAGNTVGANGSGARCFGTLQPNSGNLFQTPTDAACSYFGTNAADALLGPLGKNGGPTKTVKLLTGSPAIGLAESCPAKDQRGKRRPETDCDAGAFEREGP
jgi:CSLREA domain-containing protein